MLYSRRSWVALGVWLRYGLLRAGPRRPTELLAELMESPARRRTRRPSSTSSSRLPESSYERFVTPYDRRVGGPLPRGCRPLGWFVGITAKR